MSKILNNRTPALNRLRKSISTARHILRGLLVPVPAARPVVASPAPVVQQIDTDPTNLFAPDELPELAQIEAAAAKFLDASEAGRAADRVKRASRKLLDRLPAGTYGLVEVERVENAREVADLDAIRAIFAANGLGDVPMKRTAPSLKVQFAPAMVEAAL